MKKPLLLAFIFSSISLSANDGVFYAMGNTLVPVQETTVELRKEILRLTRKGDEMLVEVDFTFFNPGPEKTVIVGFVTPPASGDIGEEEAAHPFISDFTAVVNGASRPFQIKRMEESGFQLAEGVAEGWDFVYHFDVTFLPGENRIQHSYTFRGGSSVEMIRDFSYRLTTGKTWANKAIGDFTLEIDMGEDAFFSIPNSFYDDQRLMPWQGKGETRISETMSGLFGTKIRMASQRGGHIALHLKDFRPDIDLVLYEYQIFNEVLFWTPDRSENPFLDFSPMLLTEGYVEESDLKPLSKSQLGLLRNYFFARQGHAFKSARYREVFERFLWYRPEPGKAVALNEQQQAYVKLIKSVEDAKD